MFSDRPVSSAFLAVPVAYPFLAFLFKPGHHFFKRVSLCTARRNIFRGRTVTDHYRRFFFNGFFNRKTDPSFIIDTDDTDLYFLSFLNVLRYITDVTVSDLGDVTKTGFSVIKEDKRSENSYLGNLSCANSADCVIHINPYSRISYLCSYRSFHHNNRNRGRPLLYFCKDHRYFHRIE